MCDGGGSKRWGSGVGVRCGGECVGDGSEEVMGVRRYEGVC